tara:strand:+ start:1087 stop:1329 length:243 start_codon:yes stop_codon:yes gene_type:complete
MEKVYCKNCKYFRHYEGMGYYCNYYEVVELDAAGHDIYSEQKNYKDCNMLWNCEWFAHSRRYRLKTFLKNTFSGKIFDKK